MEDSERKLWESLAWRTQILSFFRVPPKVTHRSDGIVMGYGPAERVVGLVGVLLCGACAYFLVRNLAEDTTIVAIGLGFAVLVGVLSACVAATVRKICWSFDDAELTVSWGWPFRPATLRLRPGELAVERKGRRRGLLLCHSASERPVRVARMATAPAFRILEERLR
ncbi:MAG: hypothetical protein ACYS1C_03395, partial [Planctomycetota bacterium]